MSTKKKSSGNYYKYKTRDFFKAEGWDVGNAETKYQIPGTRIYVKKDLFGADYVIMNGEDIVFVNVTVKDHVAEHIHRFEKYPFPQSVKRWVVYWNKGAKEPTIVEQTKKWEEK